MATKKYGFIKKIGDKFFEDSPGSNITGLYQSIVPKQLKTKYSIPLVAIPGAVKLGKASMNQRNQNMGVQVGMRKLSSMTDSVLGHGPDDNTVINPYIKALNDTSSKSAIAKAKKLEKGIQTPMSTSQQTHSDLVFALHNLR